MENSREIKEINREIIKVGIKICEPFKLREEFLSFLKYGKRFRAKLLIAANNIKSKKKRIKIATLIELLHTASLIHDDVIDENNLRRGLPTVNVSFNDKFAIATGYLIFSGIFIYLLSLEKDIYLSFFETIKDMCIGEILEIDTAFDRERTESNYIETIKLKTGSLFALSCSVSDGETNLKLKKFGENFGIAFQILDDIEDLVSNENELGKPGLQDLSKGIFTLPIIYVLSNKRRESENLFSRETISLSQKKALSYIKKARKETRNKKLLSELELLQRRIISVNYICISSLNNSNRFFQKTLE
jgi:geranylgeranyl pyrophosphate synthase